VRVVREVDEETYAEAGASSELRFFLWREPTPAPAPTATP
jgi:hypothetical protein